MSENGGPRPYTRGWVAPWKGAWGTLRDDHSAGSRRRSKTRSLAELPAELFPLIHRRVKAVAAHGALAEQARELVGVDARINRRVVTVLARSFEAELARCGAATGAPDDTPEETFASRVRASATNGAKGARP